MPRKKRDYLSYAAMLKMSHMKHLIVEGPDDRRAMEQLIAAFGKSVATAVVDTADDLESPVGLALGNDRKVESLCQYLASLSVADKALGFVDRGSRRFEELNNQFVDCVRDHFDGGNIIWTRGHSVENYLFQLEIARTILDACITSEQHEDCLRLFASLFPQTLLLAAAVTVAWQNVWQGTIRWQGLRGTLQWRNITLGASGPDIDPRCWQRSCQASGINAVQTTAFLNEKSRVTNLLCGTDSEVIRWMAHGHLSLAIIWSVCARCVYEVTGAEEEAERVCNLSDRQRFNACLDPWVRLCIGGRGAFPEIVLRRLGVLA